jgi:transposase
MEKILKEAVGIDVAQNELVATLGRMNECLDIELFAFKVFANSKKGINNLVSWASGQCSKPKDVRYVMEATGVYHEDLAYALSTLDLPTSIILPNKISNYARTLDVKTVTDKTASQAIARFGLERKLDNWNPPKAIYRELKQLTRERDQIVEQRAMVKIKDMQKKRKQCQT